MKLQLEVNQAAVQDNPALQMGDTTVMVTPPIDEDFWLYRVKVSEHQAVVCFPKFSTIGIGFQVEKDDWNTNLPWLVPAEEIYQHIACNKGDDRISADDCIAAIKLLQDTIRAAEKP